MTDAKKLRTANAFGLILVALAGAAATAVFVALSYVDARLQRGRWDWAADGWMVAAPVLVSLVFAAAALAFRRERYRLAWLLALGPLAVAAIHQSGVL